MADQPIAESVRDWLPAIAAFLTKWGAGIAGSVVSVRFLPTGTSRADRLFAFGGGVLCVVYAAPAILDMFGVESGRVAALIQFVTGLLGMATAGELSATVSQFGLVAMAHDWARRRLGLPTDPPKGE